MTLSDPTYGIIYKFQGTKLSPQQAIDRLYRAGFKDVRELCVAYAVMMGESGCYLEAWHNNVLMNDDGSIKLDSNGLMTITSTDLGFIQRNVRPASPVKIAPTVEAVQPYVDGLFSAHPELARADISAKIARDLYIQRDSTFNAWYAFLNGSYKKSLPTATEAVKKYLESALLGASWR